MPKVSVIIPVYNVENYLRECLDSIVNQTLKDIEIILVDDGSTDSSLSICNEYAQKDNRITVLTQQNKGAGAARNKGLERATGDYLSILDSDDYFDLEMLEKQYNNAVNENLDISICRSQELNNITNETESTNWTIKQNYLPNKKVFNVYDMPKYIFNFAVGWSWDKLIKKQLVEKNKLRFQNLTSTNDMYFVFSALVLAKRISIVDEVLITRRRFTGNNLSASASHNKDPLCFLNALYALREKLIQTNMYKICEQSYVNFALHFYLWQLSTLNKKNRNLLKKKFRTEIFKLVNFSNKTQDYFYNMSEYSQILLLFPELFLYKNFSQRIFSIRNIGTHKMITILGIKIKKEQL